jgi:hypothetical protein
LVGAILETDHKSIPQNLEILMADAAMPQEMLDWMEARNWGNHHVEWHFTRRWDFWHALAPTDPGIQQMVDEAIGNGWTRASLQEGDVGGGIDFLMMHRAMFILLLKNFPHHSHFLRGWTTPPTDPADANDPVPSGAAFDANRVLAIAELETPTVALFPNEDAWGLFLETNIRPLPGNPTNRSTDLRTGIHNYMHNRWSDSTSAVNLGDPQVNIFNQRFWRLHGWIDYQWWRFRTARVLSDTDPQYRQSLQHYLTMMDSTGHHPHRAAAPKAVRSNRFRNFFAH